MNYGKLAYQSGKDTAVRVDKLEKIKGLNYAQASTTDANLGNFDAKETAFLYFNLQATIPILFEVQLFLHVTVAATCRVQVILDDVIIYEESLAVAIGESSRAVRVNVAGVKAGAHNVNAALTQSQNVMKSAIITCYGSGIGEDKLSSRIVMSSFGNTNMIAKKTSYGCAVYHNSVLIHHHKDVKKFDFVANNAAQYCLLRIDKKNRLFLITYARSRECYEKLIASGVTAASICECSARYEAVIAYVKNGELFYCELIDTRNFIVPRKVECDIRKITDISFIKNEMLHPILLVKGENNMCFSLEFNLGQLRGTRKGSWSCLIEMYPL